MSVPLINVSEIDDDGVQNLLSAEALTDVEDLDLNENGIHKRKDLVASATKKDSNTDVEDVDVSDEDCVINVIKHKNPMSAGNLNLCPSTVEEVQHIRSKASKHQAKLCRQTSLTADSKERHESENDTCALTDTEILEASDNDGMEEKIPDAHFSADVHGFADAIVMKDGIKDSVNPTPSPSSTPPLLSQSRANSFSFIPNPKLSFTDIEFLESEREDDVSSTKKTKKLKKRRSKTTFANTVESTNFETINVNEFNKKQLEKNEDLSEAEDFGDDTQWFAKFRKGRHSCDVYSKNAGGSHISIEKLPIKSFCERKRRGLKKSHSSPSPLFQSREDTDVEILEREDLEEDPIKSSNRASGADFTDEEILMDKDESVYCFPDVKLPRVKREMILIRENDSANPSVAVVPLDEDNFEPRLSMDLAEAVLTDAEDLSGDDAELKYEERTPEEIPETDGGVLTEKQTSKLREEDVGFERKKLKGNFENEGHLYVPVNTDEKAALTDTEDLVLGEVDQGDLNLTDVEQMENSDEDDFNDDASENPHTPTHMREMAGAMIIAKEGKEVDSKKIRRPNIHVVGPSLSENEDVFSPKDLLQIKGKNSSEYHTDIEDINLSGEEADENFSTEIMYLKGGGYRATNVFRLRSENHVTFDVGRHASKKIVVARNVSVSRPFGGIFHSQVFSTKIGYATNFNVVDQSKRARSLSMLYLEFSHTLTIPYTEISEYHFGQSKEAEKHKSYKFRAVNRPVKKLPERIAKLVGIYESYNLSSAKTRFNCEVADSERVVKIRTNFNVNNVNVNFYRRKSNLGNLLEIYLGFKDG